MVNAGLALQLWVERLRVQVVLQQQQCNIFPNFSTYNGYAGLQIGGYGEASTYLYPNYTTVLVSSATFQIYYWNGSIQDEIYTVQYPERSTFNKGSTQGRVGDLRGRQDSPPVGNWLSTSARSTPSNTTGEGSSSSRLSRSTSWVSSLKWLTSHIVLSHLF